MWGGSSSDVLCGGGGNDAMWGQSGSDSLFGNDGYDRLYGGTGDDYLNAGRGEDEWMIKGESGHDTFAVPATLAFRWWLVPVDRVVLIYDFDPNEDTEVLFVPTWYSYLLPESVWEFFPYACQFATGRMHSVQAASKNRGGFFSTVLKSLHSQQFFLRNLH
jgi:hypothetical protein